MSDKRASDMTDHETRQLAPAAPHAPRPLPPERQLFQVEVRSPGSDGWFTAAWTLTRMWADDTADAWLTRRNSAYTLAQIWHQGQMVAEHTRSAGPAAASALDEVTAALDGLAAAARAGELDSAAALAAVAGARRLAAGLEAAELAAIDAARADGATWADIAAAIGAASRQGAQKRRADLARRVPPAPPVRRVAGDLAVTVISDGTRRVVLPADGQRTGTAPAGPEPPAAGDATPPPPPAAAPAETSPAPAAAGVAEARPWPTDEEYSRTLRHHPVAGLGPEWTFTQDDGGHVVLWREKTTKAGGARQLAWKSGWEPQGPQLMRLRGGPQPSRVKALLVAAAEFERRRRAATAAGADVPLAAADGWALRQTLADKDARTWQVIAPDGTVAGTVSPSWGGARSWAARHGNPADAHYFPVTVSPIAAAGEADLAGGDGSDWKTRDAAAYAVAHWHDPDGTPSPALALMRAAAERRLRSTPRITDAVMQGDWELEKADGYEENHAWIVLVGGKPAGTVRPTWHGERDRQGWLPVDLAGQDLAVDGTGRTTSAGNAASRDAAVAALLYGLRRQQEQARKDKQRKAPSS